MFDFLKYNKPQVDNNFDLTFSENVSAPQKNIPKKHDISSDIDINLKLVRRILHTDVNSDIVLREFVWNVNGDRVRGFTVFADGIVSGKSINQFVLLPIMNGVHTCKDQNKIKYLAENVIPQNQIAYEKSLTAITDSVHYGNVGIFIDGCTEAILADIKTWEHRGIDSPVNEAVVQGPHVGFNEVLRSNTALIRTTVNNSDLIFESHKFGQSSRTPAALGYIDGIINKTLLNKIKESLSKLTDDYIFSVFDIEKSLEEKTNITMPQIITTERPDKVCRALVEGRAALLLNGSPYALILPTNITDIIASPEDAYLRKPYSVFIKLIRILAIILSLLTPALYIAITRFHPEMLLADMMISLVSARGGVPFSTLGEIIIMELSFELIKEASIRIPGSIGSSLGIVGGLILGQAAVSAGLVSPIIIILVSVCGIASFAIPSYSLSFSFRISRFVYIFAGAIFGIIGIISVLLVQTTLILGTESFGVPFFVPFSPRTLKFPFIKSIFYNYKKIPSPSYLKSGRVGESEDE